MTLHPHLIEQQKSKYTSINPMFNKSNQTTITPQRQTSVRSRAERSDKKKDIKVPLTEAEFKSFRMFALSKEKPITPLASQLVNDLVVSNPNLSIAKISCKETYKYVHVKVLKDVHKQISIMAVEPDLNIREATRYLLFKACNWI